MPRMPPAHTEHNTPTIMELPLRIRGSMTHLLLFVSSVLWIGLALRLRQWRPAPCVENLARSRSFRHTRSPSDAPRVAWLMSYPNSGTSYTLHVVRQASNFTTATNYGEEHLYDGNSLSVNANWTHGPFVGHRELKLPPHYILTKTHCGGRCVHCGPEKYIELPRTFRRACLQGKLYQNFTATQVQYSPKLVKRAVHLVRNPLDNVVSRFHLSLRHKDNYTNDARGFRAWCSQLDKEYRKHELHVRFFDPDLNHLFRGIPCHVEFYRYTEWHNLAIITARSLGIPLHTVLYDDYQQDWKRTVEGILDFLEMPTPYLWEKDVTQFEFRSYHKDYYSAEDKHNIRKLIRELASADTWDLLQAYLPADQIHTTNRTK